VSEPLIFIISGPGGAGKGAVTAGLLERVPHLWLSRSWTTRTPREGESPDAYVFVDRETFERHAAAGGFLEWVEILPGQLSGTPLPDPPAGDDIVLEIDVRGAQKVRERYPRAIVILVVAPSRDVQEARMRKRGDPPERIAERLALGEEEEATGRAIADHVVVNDDLGRATDELAAIVEAHREGR
jgi:guanylate kinase